MDDILTEIATPLTERPTGELLGWVRDANQQATEAREAAIGVAELLWQRRREDMAPGELETLTAAKLELFAAASRIEAEIVVPVVLELARREDAA